MGNFLKEITLHIKKIARIAFSYTCHPIGVSCLKCGFLTIENMEISTANRTLLYCKGIAGCPPLEEIWCYRKLWVDYELTYAGFCAQGVFDEVLKKRRGCQGFFKYRPGWSPKEHQDLVSCAISRKEKILIALISALLTLVITWLTRHFGLS